MRWLFSVLALLLASVCQADVISGRVIHVADGDTITVLDTSKNEHRVRLAGIDAPERSQAYGGRAKESLTGLVAGKTVVVGTTKRDRYGRQVGKVLLEGRDINLEQVRRGMAWHYKAFEAEQSPEDRQAYADAEDEARSGRQGLWRDRSPVPPWEHRRGGR